MSGHCDLYDNFNIRILMDRQDLIFKNNSFHFVLNNDGLGYIQVYIKTFLAKKS